MFQRTRVIIQVLITLISFFGFNEAVLAARYRNALYVSNFDARMTMAESASAAPSWLGYAGSGDIAALAGDPGNLKYNESPLRLVEFALKDLMKNSAPFPAEKTVDMVIGIAGYDFFSTRKAPGLDQLSEYKGLALRCAGDSSDKSSYFKCMVRQIYREYGWQVDKLILTGDQNLMMASAQSWLESGCNSAMNFDAIQATTTAVPYQVRNGRIIPWSSRLPEEMQLQGGYWNIGTQARNNWFSPVPYSRASFTTFINENPVRQTLFASDFVQDYGSLKGDDVAMFKRWSKTGVNTLGYQAARLSSDRHSDDYLSGSQAVSAATYQKAREQTGIAVNATIDQMVSIINRKQAEYYQNDSQNSYPIVIIGEFAADVLASPANRDRLLHSLADHDRERVRIIPGDDFFQNLSAGGQKLLERQAK